MSQDIKPEPVEPIIKWLFSMVVFLILAMIGMNRWAPTDEKIFQALYTTLAGFSGALIGRINPGTQSKKSDPLPLPPGSTTVLSQVTETPPIPPNTPEGK